MKVKLILPALAETRDPKLRGVKYWRFPPLGLAALAAYLPPDAQAEIQDEHVETLNLSDTPDLVAIQAYTSSANRAYRLADEYRARGAYVCIGGLHPTSMPREAAGHADTVVMGPGEDTWPRFLADFAAGRPRRVYRSTRRTLLGAPPLRRDLIKSHLYLVPNTLVVSRGCPHHCDFCYKDAFYRGGASFYTMAVEQALAEINRLPGKHLCFLDDNLLGDVRFAEALFDGLRGMGRVFLGAGTVQAVLMHPRLIEKAVAVGLRSLFVGFEALSQESLRSVHKTQNISRDYRQAVRTLHDLGVMVNASFVLGMDGDDQDVFDRTVDWTVEQGIESATFHIMTPYPGTRLYQAMRRQGRMLTDNWDLYDTRHAVFRPARMTATQLEEGYQRANERFHSWSAIWRSAATKATLRDRARHLLFTSALRRMKPVWSWVIRHGHMRRTIPLMEAVLEGLGRYPARPRLSAERQQPEREQPGQSHPGQSQPARRHILRAAIVPRPGDLL